MKQSADLETPPPRKGCPHCGNRCKDYTVRFWVMDVYLVPVRARNKDEAIAKAQALYRQHGEDPEQGFVQDAMEGDVGGWKAEEVAS